MAKQNLSRMLLVVSKGSELHPDPPMNAVLLAEFSGSAVRAEHYIIYELRR
jgi:hypothetical protein